MTNEHPNASLVRRFGELTSTGNVAVAEAILTPGLIWHYINPRLLQGDYVGVSGLQAFFAKLGALSANAFSIEPISMTTFGEELVVTHVKLRVTFEGIPIEMDGVVVWRAHENRVLEPWDIPAVYSTRPREEH